MATVSCSSPVLPHTIGPTPASSDGPTTAAPAPSPRMMHVERSFMSSQPENRSDADDQHVACLAGMDGRARRADRVHEAGAPGADVVRARCVDAEAVGQLRCRCRDRLGHRARRDDDEVDVARRHPARGERLATCCFGHVDDRLVGVGPATLGDAHARPDPFIVGVDASGDQVVVRDDVCGTVVAHAEDAGAPRGPGLSRS